jgi:hypothetical protein
MNLSAVITQIRQYTTMFGANVAGSANYAEGLETVASLPLPACFVYPMEDSITETSGAGGSLRQEVEERIAVVVEIDNSIASGGDRRGQAAVNTIENVKYALFKALLNWNPLPIGRYAHGMWYGGGHLLGFDRARLFFEFEFYLTSFIDEDDGFVPPAAPLEEINIYDISHPPLEMDIILPQS